MSEKHTAEERILKAVKHALTSVIKDTATPPGIAHPLKEPTLRELRECLLLISNREVELARASGREMKDRPHFTDERRTQKAVVIPIESSGLTSKNDKPEDS